MKPTKSSAQLDAWTQREADFQARAVRAGREAENRGERVLYVHGRPYADPDEDLTASELRQ